jgi:hypothetical protein
MENKMFNELLESVKEMDKISKGRIKASRRFIYKKPAVQKIRGKTGGAYEG